MSKLRLAEYHFRKAVEIHPNNAVLLGCVGMVREMPIFLLLVTDVSVRWSSEEVIETVPVPCLIKQFSYRLKMRWCVIAELKSLSLRRSTR